MAAISRERARPDAEHHPDLRDGTEDTQNGGGPKPHMVTEGPLRAQPVAPRARLRISRFDPLASPPAAAKRTTDAGAVLDTARALCQVEPLTVAAYARGPAICERDGFPVCGSLIVASALLAGCRVLWTEDLWDGPRIKAQLAVGNPFAAS